MNQSEARTKVMEEAKKIGGHAAAIADYISRELLKTEANASLIGAKSLSNAIDHVKKEARKVERGGMAMIEDNEVYGWIREFYEISDLTVAKPAASAPEPEATLSIFDLMGE